MKGCARVVIRKVLRMTQLVQHKLLKLHPLNLQIQEKYFNGTENGSISKLYYIQ